MTELTVAWEDQLETALKRRKEKKAELADACTLPGRRAHAHPVEVGCRSFIGTSTQEFLRNPWQQWRQTGKRLRKICQRLWVCRKDKAWETDGSKDSKGWLQGAAPPPGDFLALKVQNICKGWAPVDDPAAREISCSGFTCAYKWSPVLIVAIQTRL